jgi:hypothetical protein
MANLSNINNKFLVTTGGDVGIGATGPASRLEIAMNDAAGNRLGFTGDGSTSGSALWTNWITGASYLDFRLGGTTDTYTKMRITETGNVGIGTTSPNFKLDIVNAAANTATYQQFRNGTTGTASSDGTVLGIDADGDFLINNQEAKEIKLYTSDTPRLIIQSGGNVGIGGSPSAWALGKTIQINGSYGTINYNGISAILGIINAYYNGSAYIRQNVGYAGSIDFNTAISGGGFAFRTENTTGSAGDTVTLSTKMAITSAGNVGIGTTTANSKLEIYSTATFDPRTSGINIHRPGSFGQYGSIAYNVNETVISSTYTGTGATDYGGIKFQQFNNGTVPRVVMFLNTAGNVGIGTVTPSVKLEIFGNNSARNTLQNILAINGGTNSNNVYSGFGMGLVFSGRDYSNQPRDYAYIYGVQQASSTNTPGGDPGFTSQLTFYTNTGGAVNTLPTQKMVINALGNVGINVANPGFQAVDGYGQIGIEIKGGKENNQAPCIRLHETGSGKGSFELRSTRNILTSGNYFAIAEGTDTFFAIRGDDDGGGTSTRGYVGIGTESPVNKLDIRNGELTVRPSSSGNGGLGKIGYSSNNSIIQLYDSSGNEDVRISTSLSSYFNGGNVGIGTTSPDYELDVNGSIRAGRVTTNVEYYSTTNSASNQYFHIKTSVNANSQTCMHTWSVEGYAYGSTAIIDCKLAFHTDSSNNIYGRSYLGSLANNIYRSGDNYVVLVFGTVNTYYTHFYINLFEGMYTPLNSTVLAVSYSPNNSGVY